MIVARSNRWDQQVLWEIQSTSTDELDSILVKSQQAFVTRSNTSVGERVEHIQQFIDLYISHQESIAQSISLEIGKAITQSRADIEYDIGYIQWHLDHAQDILAHHIIYQDDASTHTWYYHGSGLAVVISPWNYPSSQRVRQIIPPLLAGNTVIYKCASACVRTSKLINDVLISCLPADVFIPVYGDSELGNHLTQLPVSMVIFTWSTKVGAIIQSNTSKHLTPTHLELWWSAPGIILPDTPIDDAMMLMIDQSRIWHWGQICDGLKRLFVHESQHDELITKITEYFWVVSIGNPLLSDTRMWCIINDQAKAQIMSDIQSSIDMWATTIELGKLDETSWPFIPMTILTRVTLDMPVMTKEIFWPVIPIMSYTTIDQAIEYANHTDYGLWWYLRWSDQTQIDDICSRLNTWNIAVNNTSYLLPQVPFGGYLPPSGNTREHGEIWLRSYCQLKVVSQPK